MHLLDQSAKWDHKGCRWCEHKEHKKEWYRRRRKWTYRNTKQGAEEKQIEKVPKKSKSSFMVKVGEVKALNRVEDNNWCGVIHNTFSEYKTVKQRCLVLIQNL